MLRSILVAGVAAGLGLAAPALGAKEWPQRFAQGIALSLRGDLPDQELQRILDELRLLGATHLSLAVSWRTPSVHATEIAPHLHCTAPDATVQRLVREARRRGMGVLLFPLVDVLRKGPLEWRGTIAPTSWQSWWQSYERFLLHYAALAAQTGVELLSVGSELVSTDGMRERWAKLIAAVRRVYGGPLLYSAHWDRYAAVSFWDLVDVVGVAAYFRLARRQGASAAQMLDAWMMQRARLRAWSQRIGRPFVFSEVGYASRRGAVLQPWNYELVAPPDLDEQRDAYRAFLRAWREAPELRGVFFWEWAGAGGSHDAGYTPRGKPAEVLIRNWFQGKPSAREGRIDD